MEQKTSSSSSTIAQIIYSTKGKGPSLKTLPIQSQTYSTNVKRVGAQGRSQVAIAAQIRAECLLKLTSRGRNVALRASWPLDLSPANN
ncbi:hypothetical protein ABVT39_022419 [Epinephelus coioides]